jgi:hypothetical protein
MKSIVRILARLYPASWRARYGAEFDALLEDVTPSARQALDVFLGAMSMQMTTWNFGRILIVGGVAGLALASIGAFLRPAQYVSSTNVEIYGSDNAALSLTDNLFKSALSHESLAAVIQEHNLYPRERGDESPDELVTRMEKAIALQSAIVNPSNAPGMRNLTIDFKYSDPKVAQEVDGDLVSKFVSHNLTMREVNPGGPPGQFHVAEAPSLPLKPSGPGQFDSSTKVEMYGSDNAAQSAIEDLSKIILSRESLAAIIERHNLYPRERDSESPEELVTTMSKDITIQSVRANPPVRNVTLDFKYFDPKIAQEVNADLIQKVMEGSFKMAIATKGGSHLMAVLPDRPSLPVKPSGPGWAMNTAAGTMAGALLGLVLASLIWFGRKRRAGAH